jgi:hypothetical protein
MLCLLGFLALAAGWPPTASAQQPAAVVTTVTGRVEVLPKGQTAWQPARLGMRLVEGDEMRAFPGGNAELRLPDGSTLSVVENSRFVVTKLEFGPRNEMRAALFHLAAGKLRGILAHAAVTLVQARQSIFAITTPTAVAAIRGSTVYAVFDPGTGETVVLVTDGVAYIWDFCTSQIVEVAAGQITTLSQPKTRCEPATPPVLATPAQRAQITSATQPSTPGIAAVLNASNVVVVPPDVVLAGVQNLPTTPAGATTTTVVVTPPPPPPTTREASQFLPQ